MDGLKTYNELTDEEEDQERYTNEYCPPIPLQAMTNVWGYGESERNWAENRVIFYSVRGWAEDGLKKRGDTCFLGELLDSKEPFELLKGYGYGCSAHEPNHRGMG